MRMIGRFDEAWSGKLVFGIFASLAEFEQELIRERTKAGLAAARSRGRKGGRKYELTKAQVRLAQAAMSKRDTSVSSYAKNLGSPGPRFTATSALKGSYVTTGNEFSALSCKRRTKTGTGAGVIPVRFGWIPGCE